MRCNCGPLSLRNPAKAAKRRGIHEVEVRGCQVQGSSSGLCCKLGTGELSLVRFGGGASLAEQLLFEGVATSSASRLSSLNKDLHKKLDIVN